ncbi:MAG: DUF4387 domain-containing protein [Defluviitaleaceae bacterium]|nr:DUF4387 domain-containing protein [Defluviitaleaceae bacterium]
MKTNIKTKLADIAQVIRSKNSGPFELTFDIMFKNREDFDKFVAANVLTKSVFAELYGIEESQVIAVIAFPPANAVKVTIVRPISSGYIGERDVYGAQQHRPLMGLEF